MMHGMRRSIGKGVHFLGIQDAKFKTMRISIHFLLPLRKDTVCANAMLPFLMGRAGGDYPDFTQLSQKLDDLYGAGLNRGRAAAFLLYHGIIQPLCVYGRKYGLGIGRPFERAAVPSCF